MTSIILRTASRMVLPLLLLFSIITLLRGHNEPGGGFVGGLLAAAAFALYSMSCGPDATRALLRIDMPTLLALGLLLAVVSSVPALVLGDPVFAGAWVTIHAPGLGELPIGTPLFFDVGVYLTVLAATLSMVLNLEEER